MKRNCSSIHSRIKPLLTRLATHVISFVVALTLAACANGNSGGGGAPSSVALPSYCSSIPLKTYSPSHTISGKAYYEYRVMGDGQVSDSQRSITVASGVATNPYTMSVNGTAVTMTCTVSGSTACSTASTAATNFAAALNADSTIAATMTVTASSGTITIAPKTEGDPVTTTLTTGNLTYASLSPNSTLNPNPHKDPNPIRYALVAAYDPAGAMAQCAETDSTGSFTLRLPQDNQTYTIKVYTMSNNANNTAYVMTTPTANTPYSISTTVVANSSQSSLRLLAKATGTLEGGAFNILDQVANAQNYLRTQTTSCNQSGQSNYFPDCDPVTTIPLISIYWSPGLTPAVYQVSSGPISYYLNGKSQLYIGGGLNGDFDNTDTDHFDNSVIIHEYGHFIEDQFGNPDSPGGSHNGNSIIDPRLAWGEGWADFFQAAVLNSPVYRDTFGHIGCTGSPPSGQSSCYGVAFNENLDTSPSIDIPSAAGEGNFHEFSVTRLLYAVVKPGAAANFSEIWTALHGPTLGMKAVTDRFKSIGRLHKIQQSIVGHSDWSTYRTNEKHASDLSGYATPFISTGCTTTNQAMNILMTATDNGSFDRSDQFNNNDFYYYTHPGGVLSLGLSWSGSAKADLDLYVYKEGYVFGIKSHIVASSVAVNFATSGSETISASIPAGNYIINVMAYTGSYTSTGTYSTHYNLTANGLPVCPAP